MKIVKLSVGIILLALVAFNSVYFRPLDEVLAEKEDTTFDAKKMAKSAIEDLSQSSEGIALQTFITNKRDDFDALMSSGKTLGVSDERYFMVAGEGEIIEVEEEDILIAFEDQQFRVATDFIYGNTLRDASGLVSISDYANTMDFNNISVEMNRLVKDEVVSPLINKFQAGQSVSFKGAVKVNINLPNDTLRIIPVQIEIGS